MKEILFRGKGLNRPGHYRSGKWTTGYYVKFTYENGEEEHQIISPFYGVNGVYMARCVVDPETVSQYTGLVDKYGNKIFEGDFVRGVYEEGHYYGQIIWGKGDFLYKEKGCIFAPESLSDCAGESWEVVGNIWDNPDLWEKTGHFDTPINLQAGD